jgi:hypothetical protein
MVRPYAQAVAPARIGQHHASHRQPQRHVQWSMVLRQSADSGPKNPPSASQATAGQAVGTFKMIARPPRFPRLDFLFFSTPALQRSRPHSLLSTRP